MQGCNVALKPTSILSVGSSACAQPQSFAAQDGGDKGEGAAAGGGIGSTGYIIGALALLAVGGGVAAATTNTSTKSVSP